MSNSLKKVIDVLGEETVLGFSQVLYDIIIDEISKTKKKDKRKLDTQSYAGITKDDLLKFNFDNNEDELKDYGILFF